MSTPKFSVAICGGGPGGLALASIIAKYNNPAAPVAVDLYESQEKIGTVGAGISVWPRTRVLLQKVGLMESFKGELGADDSGGTKVKGFTFRLSDAGEASREVYQMSTPSDPMLLHRSTFITALLDSLPPPPLCTIHTSKRLTHYTSTSPDGPLTLHFADGSTREADVIVGADGVRSAVRETMFCSRGDGNQTRTNYTVEPKWTGVTAYRSLVTKSMLERVQESSRQLTTPMIYCGRGRHIVTYPISRGELVNLVAFVTTPGGYGTPYNGKWVRDATPEEMRACYKGWEPEAQAILHVAERVSAWAIHIMESVPHCAVGKAAILGDALHAMETHFGAGAGQAMEDAYILARVLTHNLTDKSRLAAALRAYETSRLAFSTSVVTRARKVGQMYEFEAGERPPSGVYGESEGLSADDEEIDAWGKRWGRRITNEWSFQWSDERIVDAFWSVAETELLKLEEDSL